MRKYVRMVLRNKANRSKGGVEYFRYLWKQLRIKQGKWTEWNAKHQKPCYKVNKKFGKEKVKVTMTGNKMEKKVSLWQKIVKWFKNILGK